jgi:transposase
MSKEELVTLKVLISKQQKHTQVAKVLGISEGAVRYQRKKLDAGMLGTGCQKPFKAEVFAGVVDHWIRAHSDQRRPINVKELYEELIHSYGYEGSYRSVLRFIRARYPKPRIRTWRRVETVAGAQSQSDWAEYPRVIIAGVRSWLYAFVMTLSFSRMVAVIWSRATDQFNWHDCHNKAFQRLGGIPAVNRIDNLKTGVATGAGAWGVINQAYRVYAKAVHFHIDLSPPRAGNAKGKVEAKVKLSRGIVDVYRRSWDGLEDLQQFTDERIGRWASRTICPATGLSVLDSWQQEKGFLQPLPILPEPFDVAVTRTVRADCMVYFEGRYYPVPFSHVKEQVEVRGCLAKVQILAGGRIIRQYPRHTLERIIVDTSCYQGQATDRVLPPVPLGKMGTKLEQIYNLPVQARPIDLYAALAEVAR